MRFEKLTRPLMEVIVKYYERTFSIMGKKLKRGTGYFTDDFESAMKWMHYFTMQGIRYWMTSRICPDGGVIYIFETEIKDNQNLEDKVGLTNHYPIVRGA